MVEFLHTIDTFGSTCDALKAVCLDIIDLDMLRERIGLNEEPPFVLSDSLLLEIEKMYSKKVDAQLEFCMNRLQEEVCFEILRFIFTFCMLIHSFLFN